MTRNNDQWSALTEAFCSAGIDSGTWHAALERFACATGSRSGQLIGLGSHASVPFNIVTNVDAETLQLFEEIGGGDPERNPRVRAGGSAPVLKVLAEADFMTPEEHANHPHYRDFAWPADLPFCCLTVLERHADMLIGLAVLRSKSEGHITSEQRELFAAIAPHVRAAVRTQLALEGQGASLIAGAMDAISIAVFVCDRSGTVQSLTSAAEDLLTNNRALQLKGGRLIAANPSEASALSDAIAAAASGAPAKGSTAHRAVVLRSSNESSMPLVLDVVALPMREYDLHFMPRVLVVASGAKSADQRRAAIVQAAFGLTSAETEVALQLSMGNSADAIAASRSVSVGTVRAQIKAVLAKVGTNRQIELVARLNRL